MRVQKKDGQEEEFNREKLKKSLLAAGATESEAESVALKIEEWAPTVAFNDVVHTQVIRAKVIELLGQINSSAAEAYESYSKA